MNEREIFGRAVAIIAPDERARYLDEACADNERLRGHIEGLLLAHEDLGSFLEYPRVAGEAATIHQPITEKPGESIGPYKLLQQIGEGGMGVVFMAEQAEPIQRTVALKIIKPGMDTRQVIARFEAERQAVAMMDHPNIAKVLDAGTTDSGRPYFVMELVKGVPITKYCDEKHLSVRARLELFIEVCQAVQHAHQKGIIHRDIKPNNVLVAEYDNHAVPKVIDFGVAKATAQKLTEQTMFTEFGQVLGTMEYMSPEQAKLNQLDIDTRSDIYSLGVMLYELLAGSTPFEGKRLHAAAFDEMLRIIREEEPPKPSTRLTASDTLPSIAANRHIDPARLSKDVRGELDWIVMKALEKDRNRRYETASGFAADIERHLHDEPVEAGPPSAAYRFRKFARRHKRALTAGAMFAVVLVAATAFSILQAVRATRALEAESAARREADTARQHAKAEASIAQAVNDFLNRDLLAQAGPAIPYDRYKQPLAELKLLTVLDRAAGKLEGRFANQPLVEAALRHTIGNAYRSLGNDARAVLHLQRAVEVRRAQLGGEHPDTLGSMALLACAKDDLDLTVQVLETRRRVLGKDHPDTLNSIFNLAFAVAHKGDSARANALFRQILEAQRRVLGEDDPRTAWTMHVLAATDTAWGTSEAEDREREAMFRRARAVIRKVHGDVWQTSDIALRLGQFLNSRHRYEEAESLLKDAIARLSALPAAPPGMAAELTKALSDVYRNWGKPELAAELELKRLAANESALSRNLRLLREPTEDADLLASTANLLFQLRRFDEAEAAFRESIRLGPNDAGCHHRLGDVLVHQGKLKEAAAEYSEAIRLRPNEHGPHYGLGSAYAYGGQWDKAKRPIRLPEQILVEKIIDCLGDSSLRLGHFLRFERTIALNLCRALRAGSADHLPRGTDQAEEQGSGNA